MQNQTLLIWTKLNKLLVWLHTQIFSSTTISTTVSGFIPQKLISGRHRPRRGIFRSAIHSQYMPGSDTNCKSAASMWLFTKSGKPALLWFVSQQWKDTAEPILAQMHQRWEGKRDGKPFLETQGAYREPWVGVTKPSVFLVHVFSLLLCLMLNVLSWVSHEGFGHDWSQYCSFWCVNNQRVLHTADAE